MDGIKEYEREVRTKDSFHTVVLKRTDMNLLHHMGSVKTEGETVISKLLVKDFKVPEENAAKFQTELETLVNKYANVQ